MPKGIYKRKSPTERFWLKVNKRGLNDCWLWLASNIRGYGQFQIWLGDRSKMVKAHRFMWELMNGSIPDGVLVLHECDTPSCVNPRHLKLGTSLDNMTDKMKRGRWKGGCPKGVLNGFNNPMWNKLHSVESRKLMSINRRKVS